MQESLLTWPATAESIQTSAEAVTVQVATTMDAALTTLSTIEGDASYGRHALSADADALLGLRADLDALLNTGQILTASPYQLASDHNENYYLNPQTAIEILAAKLRDPVDRNRPTGTFHGLVVMVNESQLNLFSETLNNLTTVLNFPDWCQAARKSTALLSHSVDKLYQPAAIALPRFKPQANLNAQPLRELLKQQGSQLATLESLANDKVNIVGKLQALAEKRSSHLEQISTAINVLKTFSSSIYSVALTGNTESIATELKQIALPKNDQYTIMSLLLSPQPLTFFEELLHG